MSPDGQATETPGGIGSSSLGPITPLMVAHLRATKPWVRLVSIVGFVASGIMLLAAVTVPFVGALSDEFGGFAGGLAIGFAYLLCACLYVFTSLCLFRYASAIRALISTGDSESMELALSHQMRFWRLVGIATVVFLCIYAVVLVAIVLVALVAALK